MVGTQTAVAKTLITYGAFCELAGMIFGMFIPQMPYPRLGLAGHNNWMLSGNFALTTGIILWQKDLVRISKPLLTFVRWAFLSGILVMLSESLNAFWGTNQFLAIAGQQAGATGGTAFQEAFVTWTHIIPVLAIVPAFGIVVYHLVSGNALGEMDVRKNI